LTISSAVWIQYTNVTDERPTAKTALRIASRGKIVIIVVVVVVVVVIAVQQGTQEYSLQWFNTWFGDRKVIRPVESCMGVGLLTVRLTGALYVL